MRSFHRSGTQKLIGGVCGGLAEYLRIDPLIVRILFVILAVTTGFGLAAYLIMWVLVPASDSKGLCQEEIVRSNVEEISDRAREMGKEARQAFNRPGGPARWRSQGNSSKRFLVGGLALVTVGLLTLLGNLGLLWWFDLRKLWPLLLIALGSILLLRNVRDWR